MWERRSVLAVGVVLASGAAVAAGAGAVRVEANSTRLMPYQVFELTFQHDGRYAHPTWDVRIDVTFTSPAGRAVKVGGFFYGSSRPQKPRIRTWTDAQGRRRSTAEWPCEPADLWKARFAPSRTGTWRYEYAFRSVSGVRARGRGRFEVVPGRVRRRGAVRINPANRFRFVFEDGRPFFPVGFQDGVFDNNHNGSAMDESSMEGPFRPDPEHRRPSPPPGALYARGPSMNPQNWDVHFGRHSRAGFNLWRFSPHNFSLPVFEIHYDPKAATPARIYWEQARMVDEMLSMTRKYGLRVMYGIFGFARCFNNEPGNAAGMAKVRAIVKYSVDRWGAMVDFWEILNEQKASAEWYRQVVGYLKSIDPYARPVATSWQRPELECIDICAPHWYGRENELSSDLETARRVAAMKRWGKPVVYGEQGNGGGRPELTREGIGGVWDGGSARRMRVRCWTALFCEAALVFWETSYAKDGHHMNLWIGPEERQYVRALQGFAAQLDAAVRPVEVPLGGTEAGAVRAWGLASEKTAAVYLHHHACRQCAAGPARGGRRGHRWDHDRGAVRSLTVTVDVPAGTKGYWYDPRTAEIVRRIAPAGGRRTLEAPPFAVDLALLLTAGGAPDIDGDGVANDLDRDDDNDGVPDAADAFPLEREEQRDADGDRIGDNMDADVDGDGVADDRNGNGRPDNEESDIDGDGVPSASAVPWDAFPRDPKEWRDTDGDGVGDNADTDDDGDGWSDAAERAAGTDPLRAVSFPAE